MENPAIFRIFSDQEALHEAFRDRAADLGLSRLDLDAAGNLTHGLASKLLCDPPIKTLGWINIPKMLKATGLKLALVVDEERTAAIKQQFKPRKLVGGAVVLQRKRAARSASIGCVDSRQQSFTFPEEPDEDIACRRRTDRLLCESTQSLRTV